MVWAPRPQAFHVIVVLPGATAPVVISMRSRESAARLQEFFTEQRAAVTVIED
jgi:hypothetical protein